jgi:outer membrane protein
MIKQLMGVTLTLGAIGMNTHVQADTLLGVYGGAQMWAMESEGAFSSDTDLASFNFDDERQGSYYVAVEHFIPLLPNVKLIHTTFDTDGATQLSSAFSFGGQNYAVDTQLATDIDMSMTDHVLYYEILDNDLISIDIGLNAKKIDATIVVTDTQNATTSSQDISGYIPMLYSKVEFGIPATDWSIFAEGSYLSIDDHSVSDLNAAFEYRVIDSLALNLALQLGARAVTIELDDLDDTYTDLEFSGVYAGIEVHF